MSDRVQSRQRGESMDEQLSKAEKRAMAKAAKAKALAAKKRRDALIGVFAGVAVLALIIGTWYWIGTDSSKDNEPAASATKVCPGAFPPVPAGADKALCDKPTTSAGTGELTKLTVTPLIEGKGAAVEAGQQLTVNYVGVSYQTGEEFDASWKRLEALPFKVGAGEVIKGWDQGLVGVKIGSRVQLDIPSDLAYGDDASGGRPTGPLRFIVDVLEAK